MTKVETVCFSGHGHTAKQAEVLKERAARGA